MKRPAMQQVWQALACLLCVVAALRNTGGLEGTEFSGGWLTGPLLSIADIGTLLFLLSMVVTFVHPRVAAATGIVSSMLCVPLYFFFIAPVPFNRVFGQGHEFSIYHSPGFHWDTWAIAGMLTLAVMDFVGLRSFTATGRGNLTERKT